MMIQILILPTILYWKEYFLESIRYYWKVYLNMVIKHT